MNQMIKVLICFLVSSSLFVELIQTLSTYDDTYNDEVRSFMSNSDLLRKAASASIGNYRPMENRVFLRPPQPESVIISSENMDSPQTSNRWIYPWLVDQFSSTQNKRDFTKKHKNPRDILRGLAVKRDGESSSLTNKNNKY